MPKPAARFDAESVRASWDHAADAYAQAQASGSDYYRYEFFGPAQLALIGDVGGMSVLDVGCGNGYIAREVARRGARVTGIDISPRMIEHAEEQESVGSLGIEYHVLHRISSNCFRHASENPPGPPRPLGAAATGEEPAPSCGSIDNIKAVLNSGPLQYAQDLPPFAAVHQACEEEA